MTGSGTAYVSPLQLGLVSVGTLCMGILTLNVLLRDIPTTLWLLCVVPLVVALVTQPFVHRPSWRYEYSVFAFSLNATIFTIALWLAMFLSYDQSLLIPTVLVASICASGVYGGYQIARRNVLWQVERRKRTDLSSAQQTSAYITIAGRCIPTAAFERVLLGIRALTPLLIALGLNSAHMLSQAGVYWFSSITSLIFVIMFTLGSGGAWLQASVTRLANQDQSLDKK